MTHDTQAHIQITRLQSQIREHLGLAPEEVFFDYGAEGEQALLNLITINPEHSQSFLLHNTTGRDKVAALEAMMEYVRSYRDKEHSFTIQWSSRGSNQLHTSYFRGADVFDVLRKFSFGRDKSTVVIYSIHLNPVS